MKIAEALLLATFLAALPPTARAGGPLVVGPDGAGVGWDPSRAVSYWTDQGALGTLGTATAVAMVQRLFTHWSDVPTATISFARGGATPVDVDVTNFGPFLGPYGGMTQPSGRTTIVFDADGSIFDTLFGVGTGVLGFAGPSFLANATTTVPIGDPVPAGAHIVEGLAFLNGKWIDGVDNPAAGNFEVSLARFEAVFVHEFGHLAGLDHTQIHGLYGPPDSDSPLRTTPVETMFPYALADDQATPERDDVVALSTLYPSADFATTTGRFAGRVRTSDGAPFSGANVIARNVADDGDAVSCVSGALGGAGEFVLAGLRPGASYTVEVQEIDVFHTGGSSVGPFSPPPALPGPPERWNGAAESADPTTDDPRAATPVVALAGATVGPLDIVLNRQRFTVSNVSLEPGSQPNAFALVDLDRDGNLDLVATQVGFTPGNLVRVYRGRGDGTFAPPATVGSFPGNASVVATQLNRGVDDTIDLAVASETLNEVRVFSGNGAGGFGAPRTILDLPNANTGPALHGLVSLDLDGDAFPDLATLLLAVDGSATLYALRGSAGGTFTTVTTPLASGSVPQGALTAGDFAGTRAGDLLGIAGGAPPALVLLVGDGVGHFTASRVALGAITTAVDLRAIAAGDFDENGTLDVVLSDLAPVGGPVNWTRSFVDLLLGDGAGGFRLGARYPVPENAQSGLLAVDVDGDGHLDVASTGSRFEPGSPGARVSVGFGDGQGGIRAVETVWGLTEFPTRLAAGDLDGDGRTDLVVDDGEASAFGLAHDPAYSVLLQTGSAASPSGTTTTTTTTRPSSTTAAPTTTTTTAPATPTTLAPTTTTTAAPTTTTTTLPPPPPPAVLTAVADTYIEAGTQATWDHGAAPLLDVDASPWRLTYLKFDLRGVPATITRATLVLTCRDASDDGGTLFAVGDSSWIEGTHTGTTSGGPGLTWAQVDTNRDGKLDTRDTSRWLPDLLHPLGSPGPIVVGRQYSVDVTSVVQHGPLLYSFALRSSSSSLGGYAPREATVAADRPQLRVVYGDPIVTTTTTTTTTTTSSTTTTTLPVLLDLAPSADTMVSAGSEATWDHGTCTALKTDLSPVQLTYLRFDLRGVVGRVVRATLEMSCTNASPDGGTVFAVADSSWVEGTRCGSGGTGLRWSQIDCNHDGRIDARDALPACPYVPALAAPLAALGRVSAGKRVSVDVTAGFLAGPGLYTLAITSANTDSASYTSREGAAAARPRLRLQLAP